MAAPEIFSISFTKTQVSEREKSLSFTIKLHIIFAHTITTVLSNQWRI